MEISTLTNFMASGSKKCMPCGKQNMTHMKRTCKMETKLQRKSVPTSADMCVCVYVSVRVRARAQECMHMYSCVYVCHGDLRLAVSRCS